MSCLVKFALLSLFVMSLLVSRTFGQGTPLPASAAVSSQKLGSVLVYNYYTARSNEETDLSLTNTNDTDSVAVHLFWVNGTTNQAADMFVTLAPHQMANFLASNMSPGNAGFVVAVAVDAVTGCPRSFNHLSGDAYIKLSTGLRVSLPAEAFAALYSGGLGSCNSNATTATLAFDGNSYNEAPRALALDSVLSLLDSNQTMVVVNRLGGSLVFGGNASPLGASEGTLYATYDVAYPYDFTFSGANAQFRSSLNNSFPVVPDGFANVIPAGITGWMKLWPTTDAGILGAALNFNVNAGFGSPFYSGGQNLRYLTTTGAATLIIPVYSPMLKADLALSMTHTGNFTVGSTGSFLLDVSNAVMAKPATGTIKITDSLPSNLTLQSYSGAGWNCTGTGTANVACTNNSGLAAGASLPTLTLNVNIGTGSPTSITNTATVSVLPQQETNLTNNTASDTTNSAPTINAVAVSRSAGGQSVNSTIANVNDAEDAKNLLAITVNGSASATVNGVTVSGLTVDSGGVVKADVVAVCNATHASFTLRVTDSGSLFAEVTLNVTVTANTNPMIGLYPRTFTTAGNTSTVTPSAPPADNGTISSITATAPGFTGSFNADLATGVITISNAGPAGAYTVTVKVTDNCGSTINLTFNLVVGCPGATITVTTAADTVASDGACSLREALQAANTNAAVNECPAGLPGVDTISFAIGTGTPTINVVGVPLPAITEPVILDGASCQATRVELNGAGMTVAGEAGLTVTAGNSTIRSMVINRFGAGIRLQTGGNNVVENCLIGTDATGTLDRGNTGDGIQILSSSNNRVGGTTPSQRNLISGNDNVGIVVVFTSVNNLIQGNFIGTNLSGTQTLGNTRDGIFVLEGNTANTTIGGTAAGAGNLISGNGGQGTGAGIALRSDSNLVLGNRLGTDVTGTVPLGNYDGIRLSGNQNMIGGTAPGASNIIANSANVGVLGLSGERNSILSNAIYANAALGIDLSNDGVTSNDAGDSDNGANRLQNFPVVTQATTGNLQGTLSSTPNTAFTIQFYANPACDSSGYGEGQSLVASTSLITDAAGTAVFNLPPPSPLTIGTFITATATDPNGNTSEFSACRQVTLPTISINDVAVTEGNSSTTNAVFIVSLSGASAQTVTVQYATANSTATAPSDYTALPLTTLTFPPNTLTQAITVQVKGDTTIEPHETFFVNLNNVSNATIADNQGAGTITNDDCPTITFSPSSLPNGLTNTNYTQPLTVNPTSTYKFTISSGALPNGIQLNPDTGLLSGTPTATGSSTFTVKATDVANGCVGTKSYTLTVGCPPATFLAKWGSYGTGNGQFNNPHGVAVSSAGIVYVTDSANNRVQKFDANGNFLLTWGSKGTGNGQFDSPWGVAVDLVGNVYVADNGNHRIQKFDANGNFLLKWGSQGSGNGQFLTTRGVMVDAAGNVYVVDAYNHRIQKFDANGNFLLKWGSYGTNNGQFNSPSAVTKDAAGFVYVVDTFNNRIQKFDANGNFLLKWGSLGTGNGQFWCIFDLKADAEGNTYVLDACNNRIQKFDANGNFLLKWGSGGAADGQFNNPWGLALAPLGIVYVADGYNSRIQKFNLSPSPIANAGPDQTLTTTPGLPAPVTLNGTASSNPGGGALTYEWRKGTTVLGTSATLNVSLPVGTQTITLTVTNDCLIPATDTVVIKVGMATPTGGQVSGQLGSARVTFDNVITSGITFIEQIDPSTVVSQPNAANALTTAIARTQPLSLAAAQPRSLKLAVTEAMPSAYITVGELAFKVTTTATFSGSATVCFDAASVTNPTVFANLRVLHEEGGVLVDRTVLSGPQAPDFNAKTICASATSLGTFVVVQLLDHPPTISNFAVSPTLLWPANHNLVDVAVNYNTTSYWNPATCTLKATSNEPDTGPDTGDLAGDIVEVNANLIRLRAEQLSNGLGRSYSLSLTCTDSLGQQTTEFAEVKVNTPPVLGYATSQIIPSGQNNMISPTSGPSDSNGNVVAIVLQNVSPALSNALTVNNTTGVVTVDSTALPGTYAVTIRALDNQGTSTDATFTLTVLNACGITINPATLPAATLGTPFVQTLSASPTGSYMFSLFAGTLPPGVNLVNTLGIYSIRGIPTARGQYSFTIKAKKNNSTCETIRNYTITIP